MARNPFDDEQYDGNDEQIADLKAALSDAAEKLRKLRDSEAEDSDWPEIDQIIETAGEETG